jgi:hypothetical protein
MLGNQFRIQAQRISTPTASQTNTSITVRPGSGPCIGYRVWVESSTIADVTGAVMSVNANSDVVSVNEALIKYSTLFDNQNGRIVRLNPIQPNSVVLVNINVPGPSTLNVQFELLFNQY